MKELTKCENCGKPLVNYEEVHVLNGELYCCKSCAINAAMNEIMLTAKESATEKYLNEAEVVLAADILKEDLQDVTISVICRKTVKLPRNLTENEALVEAAKLYREGLVVAEPDDCDSMEIKYEIVKENSSCDKEEY